MMSDGRHGARPVGAGVGRVDGQPIPITRANDAAGEIRAINPGGRVFTECGSKGIAIADADR